MCGKREIDDEVEREEGDGRWRVEGSGVADANLGFRERGFEEC